MCRFVRPTPRADVNRLKDAVDDARRYEELYNELLGSYKLLRSREALAIEDAEKMAAQNAELIGAGPGVQRISYVDAVRREMALVKQVSASRFDPIREMGINVVVSRS